MNKDGARYRFDIDTRLYSGFGLKSSNSPNNVALEGSEGWTEARM